MIKRSTSKIFIGVLSTLMLLCACAQQKKIAVASSNAPIAFPGAEGFGMYTTGGRDGIVMLVTNLEDHGPGSFRAAAEAKERRIIVVKVAGTIHLETKLRIKGNVTI